MQNDIYDVLIIGSGGAGLSAAIFAAQKGLRVSVVSKVHPLKSHTVAAQGGINASLGNISEDNWKWHAYDTMKASCGLADKDSVEYMCKNAPNIIEMLINIGVEFDKTENGYINQKIYGGQATHFGSGKLAHRACFSKDRTGHNIMHKLYKKACDLNIKFYNFHFALDLIKKDNKCYGVLCWNIEDGKILSISSKHTIIATGGYSQIYSTATSASLCTGDGSGLVSRANIPLQDMEFIQFHPTAISKLGVLVTEAARSAGGVLLNAHNERFMEKYAPEFKELATRDVVSRAISTEISEGRGCGEEKDHILLDLTHLSAEYIKQNLPTIYENCQSFLKIDPSAELIPISPSAHYTMGGIPTNNNCQAVIIDQKEEVVVEGLYAIGEAASISVHGAGRLGCNSLLDLIVFGDKVTTYISQNNKEGIFTALDKISEDLSTRWMNIFNKPDYDFDELTLHLQNIMSRYVGVFRSKEQLSLALNELKTIESIYSKHGVNDRDLQWNLNFQHYIELGNMIISAKATLQAALWREESRGAHYRVDYEHIDDHNFLCHSIYYENEPVIRRKVR